MPQGLMGPKEYGLYMTVAQTGLEMAAPIVLGVILDKYLGWNGWGVIGGSVLGFAGGLTHLLFTVRRFDKLDAPDSERDKK